MQERRNYTIALDALHIHPFAVAVGYEQHGTPGGARGERVIGRVADHERLARLDPQLLARREDGVGRRLLPCNRIPANDHREKSVQPRGRKQWHGKLRRFVGHAGKRETFRMQRRQTFANTTVGLGLGAVPLFVMKEKTLQPRPCSALVGRSAQRSLQSPVYQAGDPPADETAHSRRRHRLEPEFGEHVGRRSANFGGRIEERSVQVHQDGANGAKGSHSAKSRRPEPRPHCLDRLGIVAGAEYCRAGNEGICPGRGDLGDIVSLHATVHLNPDLAARHLRNGIHAPAHFGDLGEHRGDELLPAEAGVYRHEQYEVEFVEDMVQIRERRRRVEHQPGPATVLVDQTDSPIDVLRGLGMEADDVGAGLGEIRNDPIHRFHHQVYVNRYACMRPYRLADHWADRQIWYEMVVHHVEMDQICAGGNDCADLFAQTAEIGGKNARRDTIFHGDANCSPAHPGTTEAWPMRRALAGTIAPMAHEKHHEIEISTITRYLPEQSDEPADRYVFAYTVTIRNVGGSSAQLISRHWVITDSRGQVQEVRGLGVVGAQPLLRPGESFEYSSGTSIATPVGTMRGSYQMVGEDGSRFDAAIPEFTLSVPRVLH